MASASISISKDLIEPECCYIGGTVAIDFYNDGSNPCYLRGGEPGSPDPNNPIEIRRNGDTIMGMCLRS
jgi:hypothetical protein